MPEISKTVLFNIKNILDRMAIEEKQHIAELGCGNFGFFVFPLARLVGRRGKIYAVDILKTTLQEVARKAKKENFSQIFTIWSNLEVFKGTKIESNSLDGALLINVLHQSEKKVAILREAIRLLKRKGKLLIIEWKNIDLPLGPSPERRVNLASLKTAIPKVGLAIKEEFEAGPYHYGLILTKL